jgi:selenocysteine lyase/cysteine desulfurase
MNPADAFARPSSIYLDAATYGLPPTATIEAMQRALSAWQQGTARWIDDWDRPAEACRGSFAALAGCREDDVSLLPAVSVGVGAVFAALGPRDTVVVPADEFTSVMFPALVGSEHGTTVREVPFGALADEVRAGTTLVAFSLVQMQTGLRAPLAAILERAQAVGARVLVDVTQALPFLNEDEDLSLADYVVCAAYKHLLSPRGVAFMATRPEARETIQPLFANWRAADDPYGRYFGGPLTLGRGGRAFDVSLAWLPWIGAIESMRLLVEWRDAGALREVRERADQLGQRLGLPSTPSTLVCVQPTDPAGAKVALEEAGIRASVRGTAIRLAPHVYNSDADIDAAVSALAPFVGKTG